MDKPESVRRVELKNTLEATIAQAKLPPYVIAEILAYLLQKENAATERQYATERAAWVQAQKEKKTQKEEKADVHSD